MAGLIEDHVNVTIDLNAVSVTRQNFGLPILLDYFSTSIFSERVRTYRTSTILSALVSDGFTTTSPIYRMAQAIAGASVKVREVKVGRLALAYTQDTEINVTSITEGDSVGCVIIDTDGTEYEAYHVVTAGQTWNDVAVALKAVVDALGLAITIAAPGFADIRLVANNPGEIFYFHTNTNCTINEKTPDPGIATDLANIQIEDDEWYGILTSINSFAVVDAVAGWVETQRKIYVAQSQDSEIVTSGTGDIGTELKDDARFRTALIYTHAPSGRPLSEYPACAWIGKTFPKDPGSQTWMFKSLSGVAASLFTATELSYLVSKNVNHYVSIAGVSVTRFGTMAISATRFIDQVRLRDWLEARIQEEVFALMASNDKLPYDDDGIDMIRGAITAVYEEGAGNSALQLTEFSFEALPADEQASGDVLARTVRDIVFGGRFTGAIHSVYITGNVQ
jgi:hypothetical protein